MNTYNKKNNEQCAIHSVACSALSDTQLENKLTKKQLIALEKQIEILNNEVGLKEETMKEIKYKITIHFKDAPE